MRHWPSASKTLFLAAAIAGGFCASILIPHAGFAQDVQARQQQALATAPKAMPSDVMLQVQALGPRMRTAGKEESVFDGQLVDPLGQQKPLRVIHQISGAVRIESSQDKSAVSFDGERTNGIGDHTGEALLDMFVLDSPEGFIYALRSGASMQLLGRGFVPDSSRSDAAAPRYDIYEVTSHERTREDHAMPVRRYYFDSNTGLLASTRYTDRSGIAVETRFSGWGQADGSAYPSRIERYENGRLSFSFVAGTVAARSKQNSAISK